MTKTVSLEAQQQLDTLLNEVAAGSSVVIERDGKAEVAMIPIAQFEAWKYKRQRALERLESQVEALDISEDLEAELNAQTTDVIRELRKNRA